MYIHTHIMMSSSEEQGEGEGGEENKTKRIISLFLSSEHRKSVYVLSGRVEDQTQF